MVCRFSAWKMDGSFRLVMMRVLDGGVGIWSGGRLERSRERGVREREEVREWFGDDGTLILMGGMRLFEKWY
jgi:hypothetical protein